MFGSGPDLVAGEGRAAVAGTVNIVNGSETNITNSFEDSREWKKCTAMQGIYMV